MAKDIEKINREVFNQAVGITPSTAHASMTQVFNKVSEFAGNAATNLAIENATAKGTQLAMENRGKPQKLAPSIGAATKAYNNAYNNVTINLMGLEGKRLMNQTYLQETQPGRLGSGTFGRVEELNRSTIQGVLEQTPDHLKTDVGLELLYASENLLLKTSSDVMKYNYEAQKASTNDILNSASSALFESMMSNNKEGIKLNEQKIRDTLDDQEALGLLTKDKKNEALKNLASQIKIGQYSRAFMDSLDSDLSMKKGDEFLARLGEKKPADLTWEEYGDLVPTLTKIRANKATLLNGDRLLTYATAKHGIVNGSISTYQQIDDLNLSALQKEELALQLDKQLVGSAKELQKLLNTSMNIRSGLGRMSTENEVNNWYDKVALPAALERKREIVAKNGQDPDQAYLTLIDKAQAVTGASTYGIGRPVTNLTDEIFARLENGSPEQAMEAAQAYQILADQQNSIPENDRASTLARSILNNRYYSGNDTLTAIQDARKAILEVTPEIRKSRETRLKEKKEKDYQSDYSGLFGKSPKSADTDLSYSLYKDYYNQAFMTSGNEKTAMDVAKDKLWPRFGEDPFGIPGKVMYLPITKTVPSYNAGSRLANYIDYTIKELIEANQVQRDEGTLDKEEIYRWAYRTKLPDSFTEKEFAYQRLVSRFDRPSSKEFGLDVASILAPTEHYILYKDKRYELYLDSDIDSGTRTDGIPRYYGVILVDGSPYYLKDNRTQSGLFEIPITSPYLLTPKLTEQMDDEQKNEATTQYLKRRFDAENPRAVFGHHFPDPMSAINEGERLKRKQKYIEENLKAKRKLLFGEPEEKEEGENNG